MQGTFEINGLTANFTPKQLIFPKYVLLETFGKQESEEAAARILIFSKQLDKWVGVSWRALAQVMQEELEEEQNLQKLRDESWDAQRTYLKELKAWKTKNYLTLGIYSLFATKPVEKEVDVPESDIAMSGLHIFGPQSIVNGLHMLIEKGFVELKKMNNEDVFFPTQSFVDKVARFA